jgi:hypothetical protein
MVLRPKFGRTYRLRQFDGRRRDGRRRDGRTRTPEPKEIGEEISRAGPVLERLDSLRNSGVLS